MAVGKTNRLSKVAREFNVGIHTIVDFLQDKGFDVELNPNTKITEEMYHHIESEYSTDLNVRKKSEELSKQKAQREAISIEDIRKDLEPTPKKEETSAKEAKLENIEVPKQDAPKVVGKIDLEKTSSKKTQPAKEDKKEPKVEEAKEKIAQPAKEAEKQEPKPKKKEAKKEEEPQKPTATKRIEEPKVLGKIDIEAINKPQKASGKAAKKQEPKEKAAVKETPVSKKEEPKAKEEAPVQKEAQATEDDSVFKPTQVKKLSGPTVVGKIDLPKTPQKSENGGDKGKKKKRKRIRKDKERVNVTDKQGQQGAQAPAGEKGKGPQEKRQRNQEKGQRRQKQPRRPVKAEVSEEDVQKQIKDTLARLTAGKGKSKASRHRRDKRDAASQRHIEEMEKANLEKNIIKVAEFVTVAELATMMDVQVNQIIASCMSLGLFVSINRRRD
jgi:translation initiation factor IF-2